MIGRTLTVMKTEARSCLRRRVCGTPVAVVEAKLDAATSLCGSTVRLRRPV
ncbi:hypothetical protein KKP04_04835 [Rhodomicrobium sp. Az07]|nr:hypothetical protein [Rhodomicrobium sp. Az07]